MKKSKKPRYYTLDEFKALSLQEGSIFFGGSEENVDEELYKETSQYMTSNNTNNNSNELVISQFSKCMIGKYRLVSSISKGSFGQVFVAEMPTLYDSASEKCILRIQLNTKENVEKTTKELEILRKCSIMTRNDFIAKILHFCQINGHSLFCFEYFGDCSLQGLLTHRGSFDEVTCRFYIGCLLIALNTLHSLNISLGKLQLDSIMIDASGYPKLFDFSGSSSLEDLDNICSLVDDYVLVARCMYQLLTGKSLEADVVVANHHANLSSYCILFLQLTIDKRRLSSIFERKPNTPSTNSALFSTLIKHPFFKGMDWRRLRNKEVSPPFPISPQIKPSDVQGWWKDIITRRDGIQLVSLNGELLENVEGNL